MSNKIIQELSLVPALREVPKEQLAWFANHSVERNFKQGELLFQKGTPIDNLLILLKGKFVIKIEQNNQFRVVGHLETHEIGGLLPYSRATNAAGRAEAVQEAKVLALHKDHFKEMITDHHELTTVFVHVMSTRIREFTKKQQQDDKMMSLGKLSAGLAHELNNPSAAVVSCAQALRFHLGF